MEIIGVLIISAVLLALYFMNTSSQTTPASQTTLPTVIQTAQQTTGLQSTKQQPTQPAIIQLQTPAISPPQMLIGTAPTFDLPPVPIIPIAANSGLPTASSQVDVQASIKQVLQAQQDIAIAKQTSAALAAQQTAVTVAAAERTAIASGQTPTQVVSNQNIYSTLLNTPESLDAQTVVAKGYAVTLRDPSLQTNLAYEGTGSFLDPWTFNTSTNDLNNINTLLTKGWHFTRVDGLLKDPLPNNGKPHYLISSLDNSKHYAAFIDSNGNLQLSQSFQSFPGN